ncbi:hypothetical protein SAMCFNEI73_pC1698 (plasmid) [Sinorhizobium americanum]|uniref:Uncharacterized protein n=1 Tax=Sinorhizobium americanum TaxID=194963 RepID=A0A1L3LZ77_9HYPH|nr:hypothetical protein SAMCFNEI73_pC1698 [Sinorhizobium americanum]
MNAPVHDLLVPTKLTNFGLCALMYADISEVWLGMFSRYQLPVI